MTAWRSLLGALGFALWAGVPFAHPRAPARTMIASPEAPHVRPSSPPAPPSAAPTPAIAPEIEQLPATPQAKAKRLRLRRSKPRVPAFDAGDGRAILETGLRPAVLESAPPR